MSKFFIIVSLLMQSSLLLGKRNEKSGWDLNLYCFKERKERVVTCNFLSSIPASGDWINKVIWKLNGKEYSKKQDFRKESLSPGKYTIEATVLTKKGLTVSDSVVIDEDRSEAILKANWINKKKKIVEITFEKGELKGDFTFDNGLKSFVPSKKINLSQNEYTKESIEAGEPPSHITKGVEVSNKSIKFKTIMEGAINLKAIDKQGFKIDFSTHTNDL